MTDTGKLPQPTSQLVKQAMVYIQQNFTRTLSLEELADTVGVSKSHLSRIFTQVRLVGIASRTHAPQVIIRIPFPP